MHLQVAAVDAVVVGDDHLRELHVLVAEGLQHAVQLLDDQVEAAQRVYFQFMQLLLEMGAPLKRSGRGLVLGAARGRHRGCLRAAAVGVSRTCR